MISIQEISFSQPIIFFTICEFLNKKDVSKLQQCSQSFYNKVEFYYKNLLLKENLIQPNDIIQSKYASLYGNFFKRQIIQLEFIEQNIQDEESNFNPVNFNKSSLEFQDEIIINFMSGQKFTAFHTMRQNLYYMKTESFSSHLQCNSMAKLQNVKQFSIHGKDLIYLTSKGQIKIIIYDDKLDIKNQSTMIIEETIQNPAREFSERGIYLIFISQNKISQYEQIFVYYLDNLDQEKEDNLKNRLKSIVNHNVKEVKSYGVGASTAYFVDQDHQVLYCEIDNFNQHQHFQLSQMDFFKKKSIHKIYIGMRQCFALEREEIEPFEKWTKEQITDWAAKSKDFNDFAKLFKYNNITGKDLKQADQQYLIEKIGMTDEILRTLLFTQMNKYDKLIIRNQVLYGWGSNKYGELAASKCTYINIPVKIDIRNLDVNEVITDIKIGWKHTCMITNMNKIWINKFQNLKDASSKEEKPKKKNSRTSMGFEILQVKKEEKLMKTSKNKLKEIERHRKESDSNRKESLNQEIIDQTFWINLDSYSNQKSNQNFFIVEVFLAKTGLQILTFGFNFNSIIDDKKQKKQFRPSDKILDKIQWDPKLNQDDFIIGYLDRFNGIMDVDYQKFIQSEAKSHRIQYFKLKTGDIMWDRNLRIDKF